MRELPQDAAQSYERWRQQWLDGHDNNAIHILRLQGLYWALIAVAKVTQYAMTINTQPQCIQVQEVTPAEAVMVEAASQIQRLLQISSMASSAVDRNFAA